MSDGIKTKPLNGWWVFTAFALFFGVIVLVNSVYITMALRSHSGVVTEDAYRKGLAFNEKLEQARNQPEILNELRFENNILRWKIADKTGLAIDNAGVTAEFMRPVKAGNDFNAQLHHDGNGIYSIKPDFPVKGSWKVILSAKWDNNTYQTVEDLIVR